MLKNILNEKSKMSDSDPQKKSSVTMIIGKLKFTCRKS